MIQPIYIKGDNNQLYKQLDAALAQRAHYVELKEKSLMKSSKEPSMLPATKTN